MVARVSYLDFGEFLIEQDFKSPFRIVGAGEFILYVQNQKEMIINTAVIQLFLALF